MRPRGDRSGLLAAADRAQRTRYRVAARPRRSRPRSLNAAAHRLAQKQMALARLRRIRVAGQAAIAAPGRPKPRDARELSRSFGRTSWNAVGAQPVLPVGKDGEPIGLQAP